MKGFLTFVLLVVGAIVIFIGGLALTYVIALDHSELSNTVLQPQSQAEIHGENEIIIIDRILVDEAQSAKLQFTATKPFSVTFANVPHAALIDANQTYRLELSGHYGTVFHVEPEIDSTVSVVATHQAVIKEKLNLASFSSGNAIGGMLILCALAAWVALCASIIE